MAVSSFNIWAPVRTLGNRNSFKNAAFGRNDGTAWGKCERKGCRKKFCCHILHG